MKRVGKKTVKRYQKKHRLSNAERLEIIPDMCPSRRVVRSSVKRTACKISGEGSYALKSKYQEEEVLTRQKIRRRKDRDGRVRRVETTGSMHRERRNY